MKVMAWDHQDAKKYSLPSKFHHQLFITELARNLKKYLTKQSSQNSKWILLFSLKEMNCIRVTYYGKLTCQKSQHERSRLRHSKQIFTLSCWLLKHRYKSEGIFLPSEMTGEQAHSMICKSGIYIGPWKNKQKNKLKKKNAARL